MAKAERTLRWTAEQKREIRYEAEAYSDYYGHLQGLLNEAEDARRKTFDRRHKVSYEDAKCAVVDALRADDVTVLNALLVATGNLHRQRLRVFPRKTAQEWVDWINEVVNHPPNVYLGSSARNQALGRGWDPRLKGDEFGVREAGQIEPGSPVTEWQLQHLAGKTLQPNLILADENVLAAAWAVRGHYKKLAKMAKVLRQKVERRFFAEKASALPHPSWGVTHTVMREGDVSEFQGVVELGKVPVLELRARPQ